jgi:hypothetical protein
MKSKRLKQLVLGSGALAALALGGSASAGAATSTTGGSQVAGDTGASVGAARPAGARGGSVGAMNHVRDSWIHDLYLADHEQ